MQNLTGRQWENLLHEMSNEKLDATIAHMEQVINLFPAINEQFKGFDTVLIIAQGVLEARASGNASQTAVYKAVDAKGSTIITVFGTSFQEAEDEIEKQFHFHLEMTELT